MHLCRRLRLCVVATAALCGLSAWAAPAFAGFVLDARYSGVVTSIDDQYGLFGPVTLGDSVDGIVRYSSPVRPFDFGDASQAEYHFPVTAGGVNEMTANLGELHLEATQNVIAVVYNQPVPESPPDSIYGYDFQFNDGDTSLLTTTGLPAGYRVRYVDPDLGLFSTDPSLFDPPNPPSALLPIEQYDSFYTSGNIDAVIEDSNGHFAGQASIEFQITSVASVPEPPSALLAGTALSVLVAWARWRRTRRLV